MNLSPQKIAEALKMNSYVQFISLCDNIRNDGAENIAKTLKMNSSVCAMEQEILIYGEKCHKFQT